MSPSYKWTLVHSCLILMYSWNKTHKNNQSRFFRERTVNIKFNAISTISSAPLISLSILHCHVTVYVWLFFNHLKDLSLNTSSLFLFLLPSFPSPLHLPCTLSRSAFHYFYPPECGPAPLHANGKPQVLFCLASSQHQPIQQHLCSLETKSRGCTTLILLKRCRRTYMV